MPPLVEGITRLVPKAPESGDSNALGTKAPYRLFNIGYGSPVKLMDFIEEIEHNLGIRADKNLQPIQPGDVPKTWAEVDNLFDLIGFRPRVSTKDGVKNFIDWYKAYYKTD